MVIEPFKLLGAFHGHEIIESFEEASAFVERLDLTTQNRPHWQMAVRRCTMRPSRKHPRIWRGENFVPL
jgi:hypothetical protein